MRPRNRPVLHMVRVGTTPTNALTKGRIRVQTRGQINQHGRTLARDTIRNPKADLPTIHHDQPRASSAINDNYCVDKLQEGLLAGSQLPTPGKTLNTQFPQTHVNFIVLNHYCTGAFIKERSKSRRVRLLSELQIKICERCFLCQSIVFCKTYNKCPTCCLKSACRGQTSKFLAKIAFLGASPKVVQILREGYTLPFRIWPNLTRSPTIISCYVNPHRNLYLLEALHQLMDTMDLF